MAKKPKLKKVYFIDDDEATNAYHTALSKDFNLAENIHIFSSGFDALEALQTITDKLEFPELIFVDINMPKIDGHEFSKRVQKMEGFDQHNTCISLLTNSKDIKDVLKADENSIVHYFWKPLTEEALKNVLKEGLRLE